MENLIIICVVIGIVFALWDMIKIILVIAGFLLLTYTYISFDLPENPPVADNLKKIPTVDSEDTLPIRFVGKEPVNRSRIKESNEENTKIEVHHYFHNTPQEVERNISPFDTQRVKNSPSPDPAKPKIKELDHCNNIKFNGKRFFLTEGFYEIEKEAKDRIKYLEKNRIRGAKIIWLPCYQAELNHTDFAIVLGRPCKSQKSVEKYKDSYEFDLYSADIYDNNLEVISLEKVVLEIYRETKGGKIGEDFLDSPAKTRKSRTYEI